MVIITYLQNARIGIATEQGKPYYRFSRILKDLGMNYDSILPKDIPNFDGDIILTTEKRLQKPRQFHYFLMILLRKILK